MSFEDQVVNPSTAPSLRPANYQRDFSSGPKEDTMPNQPEQGAHPMEEASHFHWMKTRFMECFGLPTDMYKRRNLISFDGVILARGYNRVVATWQGLFYELKDEDINYKDLEPGFNTAQGCSTLTTKGVRIFKLSRADTRAIPRPHRFAVLPRSNSNSPCNPLKVGVWYAHVYQTKLEINGFLKTLNSISTVCTDHCNF